jgi:hypothetical protein
MCVDTCDPVGIASHSPFPMPISSDIIAKPVLTLEDLGLHKHDDYQKAVTGLEDLWEAHAVRWVQFPCGILLFLIGDDSPESGWLFVFDRKIGVFYSVDFETYPAGFRLADYDTLYSQHRLWRLAQRPWVLKKLSARQHCGALA